MRQATPEEICNARRNMCNQYAFLDDTGNLSGIVAADQQPNHAELDAILKKMRMHRGEAALEEHVNDLLNWGWKNRKNIWPYPPKSPLDLLNPQLFFELLGYQVSLEDSLGNEYLRGVEIQLGGIIDTKKKTVTYSNDPSLHSSKRRFTLAHELGHACLHSHTSMHMHRDIAIDAPSRKRDKVEQQADAFAAMFTMPRKQIEDQVYKRFDCSTVALCELTEFLLGESNMKHYRQSEKYDGKRMALAKTIAQTTSYGQRQFVSLADQFEVSIQAMAIRLIQLRII